MIGNQSSQVAQPKDDYIEYYVEQNKKEGGENNMSDDNLDKGVVPAVDPASTTEPDGKGTMATAKGDFPASAKDKVTRRYAKKSLRKAARFIEKAVQTMENIPALSKADLPKVGRAGSVTVANATFDSDAGVSPNPTEKALPDATRAASPAKVDNTTNPYGVQLTTVRKAIKTLQKAEKKLVAVDRYAQVANTSTKAPKVEDTTQVAKDITDNIEDTANSVIKAVACCDNSCGGCKGPGCGCCSDCPTAPAEKAVDSDNDGDTDSDTDADGDNTTTPIKKSIWGGHFIPQS